MSYDLKTCWLQIEFLVYFLRKEADMPLFLLIHVRQSYQEYIYISADKGVQLISSKKASKCLPIFVFKPKTQRNA